MIGVDVKYKQKLKKEEEHNENTAFNKKIPVGVKETAAP